MPKRPDSENILAKFRSVNFDREILNTGFFMNQIENSPLGEKRFEIRYTAIVTLNAAVDDASEEETAPPVPAPIKETALKVNALSDTDFLKRL